MSLEDVKSETPLNKQEITKDRIMALSNSQSKNSSAWSKIADATNLKQ
jgi:hypothetical protein